MASDKAVSKPVCLTDRPGKSASRADYNSAESALAEGD